MVNLTYRLTRGCPVACFDLIPGKLGIKCDFYCKKSKPVLRSSSIVNVSSVATRVVHKPWRKSAAH